MVKTWSKLEIDYLLENYTKLDLSQISEKLGRTTRAVEGKANKLGLRKTKTWSETDISFLEEMYETLSNNEIAHFLDRTIGSIERKASKLNLKKPVETIKKNKRKWSSEDIEFLKANYKKIPPLEICQSLGISMGNMYRMAKYYGLQESTSSDKFHINSYRPWTEEETNFLIENHLNMTQKEISEFLGRPVSSIIKKKSYIGLKKYERKKDWSRQDIDFLKENYKSGSIIEMMDQLGRTFKAIHTKANELNLSRDTSTYIEREVESILSNLKIPYESQVNIRGFVADFQLRNNKIIEVHGDYWHCNPKVYKEPKNETQRRKIKQDRMKRACFNELGYTVLYIWELDINNNYDQVIKIIKQFAVQ
ncbi:hypothetical protein ACFSFW_04765 [Fredinandcohnia salidurans]|uniref:Uncharacterized protein n=1 Tax=Fredinandcohnia salidurans TaxID=2595041 RepID=A0ABW4MKI2_9BACI